MREAPFVRKKSVVHRIEPDQMPKTDYLIDTG